MPVTAASELRARSVAPTAAAGHRRRTGRRRSRTRAPLPPELRELYKITREGIVGLFELTNPADLQRSNKVSRGGWKELLFEIEEGERGVEGLKDWPGERPQGNFLYFGSVGDMDALFYELDGPLQGRIANFDFHSGSCYVWSRIADSLYTFFEWQEAAIPLANSHVIEIGNELAVITHTHIYGRTPEFTALIEQIRPVINQAGGIPGIFGVYDAPAGYNDPSAPH